MNTPILDEKSWERINARRCKLIRQKYAEGLGDAERVELAALEEEAKKYLDAVAPLSDCPLDAFQAHVDRIKANKKNVP